MSAPPPSVQKERASTNLVDEDEDDGVDEVSAPIVPQQSMPGKTPSSKNLKQQQDYSSAGVCIILSLMRPVSFLCPAHE